jgi:hypothetical protein
MVQLVAENYSYSFFITVLVVLYKKWH